MHMTLGAAQEFRSYVICVPATNTRSAFLGRFGGTKSLQDSILVGRQRRLAAAGGPPKGCWGGAQRAPGLPKPLDHGSRVNNKRNMPRNYSIQAHLSRISAALALHVHLRMVECTAGMVIRFFCITRRRQWAFPGRFGGTKAFKKPYFARVGRRSRPTRAKKKILGGGEAAPKPPPRK
jgi:hypothetical protein